MTAGSNARGFLAYLSAIRHPRPPPPASLKLQSTLFAIRPPPFAIARTACPHLPTLRASVTSVVERLRRSGFPAESNHELHRLSWIGQLVIAAEKHPCCSWNPWLKECGGRGVPAGGFTGGSRGSGGFPSGLSAVFLNRYRAEGDMTTRAQGRKERKGLPTAFVLKSSRPSRP